jgi:hypothetical protein
MNRRLICLTATALTLISNIAMACPMCKDSIPNSDAAQATSLPGGFNLSVYYMLVSLFVTIGLCATVITKGVKSTNARMVMPKQDQKM